MYEERETWSPLILFEYDHKLGNYCLMLSDNHMVAHCDLFEAAGYMGGGYDWGTIARQSIRAHAPELTGRLGMDPEAGTFVAYGTDLEALQVLGGLLHAAFHDQVRLQALIEGADPDWFD